LSTWALHFPLEFCMHSGLIPRILADYSVQRRDGRWFLFAWWGFLFLSCSWRVCDATHLVTRPSKIRLTARESRGRRIDPINLVAVEVAVAVEIESWLRASPAVHQPTISTEAPPSRAGQNATKKPQLTHTLEPQGPHTLTEAFTDSRTNRFSGVTGFSRLRRPRQFQPHLAHRQPMRANPRAVLLRMRRPLRRRSAAIGQKPQEWRGPGDTSSGSEIDTGTVGQVWRGQWVRSTAYAIVTAWKITLNVMVLG